MTPTELPFSLPGFEIDDVPNHGDLIEIIAHSIRTEAICPTCQCRSRRIHSYYQRRPTDLPVSDQRVRLVLTVRRFRCQNGQCSKHTFAEQWPDLLVAHAQRPNRLDRVLEAVAFALGGQAGQHLALKLQMPVSGDTLLRLIRRIHLLAPAETSVPSSNVIIHVKHETCGRAKIWGHHTRSAKQAMRHGGHDIPERSPV